MAKKIATIDFETDPFEFGHVPEPFLAVYHDGDQTAKFWGDDCAKQLFDFIKGKKVDIYAHNGGKFDVYFLLKFIKSAEPKIINGRIASIKIGKATLKDSYCILPVPLKAFNKVDIDIQKMHRSVREKHKDEIIHYCEMDCIYLLEAVKKFVDQYGVNLTLAGAAMKFWKNQNPKNMVAKLSESKDAILREYYFGGRTEVLNRGIHTGNFKYYDINSAYPFAMSNFEHPAGNAPRSIECLDEPYITKSFFTIKAISRGALPYRDKDKAVRFPNDNTIREYKCTGWELKTGLETGTIDLIAVVKQLYFEHTINFKEYIKYFFDMKAQAKKDNDKTNYIFSKLFMNSLYGKFGTNPREFKDYLLAHPDYREESYTPGPCVWEDLRIFTRPTEKPANFLNVATAASITGFVRAYLFENILKTKNPLYCDTDSIICADGSALSVSEKLGDWDIEGDNITKVAVAGKKMYATFQGDKAYKTGCKGARLTAEQILKVAQGEILNYRFDAPSFSLIKPPTFTERRIKATF